MFKSLAAVAAVTVCLTGNVFVAEAARAGTRCVNPSENVTVCTADNGDYGNDLIQVWKDGRLITDMKIICTGNGGNRWSAKTSAQKSDNQKLANWWCRNY